MRYLPSLRWPLKYQLSHKIIKVKEDSVKEIIERAKKKGLLKKKEKSVKKKVQGSKSPKPCPKSSTKHQLSPTSDRKNRVGGEDHARFKF